MRAGAAQPCQVRKEATVSGGLLRRDHPGKGILILGIYLTKKQKRDIILLGGLLCQQKRPQKRQQRKNPQQKQKQKRQRRSKVKCYRSVYGAAGADR